MDEIRRDRDGTYYRRGRSYTSRDDGYTVTKSAVPFGSVETAEECLEAWRRAGMRGAPGSPASFFREVIRKHHARGMHYRCNATVNNLLRHGLNAGWQEALERGSIRRAVWLYDLNKAYYAAAGAGLPSRLRPYVRGDRSFVAVVDRIDGVEGLPLPRPIRIHEDRPRVVVTSETIRRLNLRVHIVDAVSYDETDVNLYHAFYDVHGMISGKPYKKVQQSYWGMFIGSRGVVAEQWRGGELAKTWHINNRMQNLAWAALISQRVMAEVWEAVICTGGISVYVDSVLTTSELPTGDLPGEWKLQMHMANGVYIRTAGMYDPLPAKPDPAHWYKHSGIVAHE